MQQAKTMQNPASDLAPQLPQSGNTSRNGQKKEQEIKIKTGAQSAQENASLASLKSSK